MDKTPVCGTGAPGSTPGESTRSKYARNFFLAYFVSKGGFLGVEAVAYDFEV